MLANLTNKVFHTLGERNIRNKSVKIMEREAQVLYNSTNIKTTKEGLPYG